MTFCLQHFAFCNTYIPWNFACSSNVNSYCNILQYLINFCKPFLDFPKTNFTMEVYQLVYQYFAILLQKGIFPWKFGARDRGLSHCCRCDKFMYISLSLYIYIYISLYIYTYIYIYIFTSLSRSLSLSLSLPRSIVAHYEYVAPK